MLGTSVSTEAPPGTWPQRFGPLLGRWQGQQGHGFANLLAPHVPPAGSAEGGPPRLQAEGTMLDPLLRQPAWGQCWPGRGVPAARGPRVADAGPEWA